MASLNLNIFCFYMPCAPFYTLDRMGAVRSPDTPVFKFVSSAGPDCQSGYRSGDL